MIGWMDRFIFFVCGAMLILMLVGLVSAAIMLFRAPHAGHRRLLCG